MTDKDRLKVYVAGPYTDGAWEYNIRDAVRVADAIWNHGHIPFIPHTMTTLWALIEPKPKDEWLTIDVEWLDECDALVRINGESEGADTEVEYANQHGITVYDGVDSFLEAIEEAGSA